MSKKKNTDDVYVVRREESLSNTNTEPTPYEVLERRVKDFVDATLELLEVQEALIRNERRHESARETFDFNLKWLKDTMDINKKVLEKTFVNNINTQ